MTEPKDPRVEWIVAFTKAQGLLPTIGKESRVNTGQYQYTYAALPDILDAISPVLRANGLVLTQSVAGTTGSVEIETRIYHKAGWVETFGPTTIGVSGNAQAVGSAITYARRYALTAALGIAPDDDDDGQSARPVSEEIENTRPITAKDVLWDRAQIFTNWDRDTKIEKINEAKVALAIDEISTDDLAGRIFDHLVGNYQEQLPIAIETEEGYQ